MKFRGFLFAVLLLTGWAMLPAEAKRAKMLDIADTVASNPILTKFSSMLQASDLATFLSSKGPFTVFVPTDSAFSRLPPGSLDVLLQPENKVRLQDIVLLHVVNGKMPTAKDLLKIPSLISCQGNPLPIKTSRTGVQLVMKAKIVHADIRCQNGIIHEIDTLLMPPESSLPPIALPPPPGATNAPPISPTNGPSAVTPE